MSPHSDDYIQELSAKLLSGTISDTELSVLERWYDKNPVSIPEWYLKDETRQGLADRLYDNIQNQIKPVKRLIPNWLKISAAASVVIASGFLITYQLSRKTNAVTNYSITSLRGHIKKILLPDHTIVWLKGDSYLQYPSRFADSTRNVILHGEALFEVYKDRTHPFIIHAGSYITRVLGTSFNIKENQHLHTFKLTVLTGKVLVAPIKSTGSTSRVLVMPGKEFESADVLKPSVIVNSKSDEQAAVIKGTEYDMDFERTSFADVKIRIENKFDTKLLVNDDAYRNCNLSANVTDQSLENTLKVICAAIGANYTIQNNKITISGGGCN